MSLLALILLIAGCLVAGYWIVSSVMDDSVDVIRKERDASAASPNWYLELDIAPDASEAEIRAAMKRRLAQAKSGGDPGAIERITRAAEEGLKRARGAR